MKRRTFLGRISAGYLGALALRESTPEPWEDPALLDEPQAPAIQPYDYPEDGTLEILNCEGEVIASFPGITDSGDGYCYGAYATAQRTDIADKVRFWGPEGLHIEGKCGPGGAFELDTYSLYEGQTISIHYLELPWARP